MEGAIKDVSQVLLFGERLAYDGQREGSAPVRVFSLKGLRHSAGCGSSKPILYVD